MELKNIILVIIAILIIALVGVGLYVLDNPTNDIKNIPTSLNISLDDQNESKDINLTNTTNATIPANTTNATNSTNVTVVGDNTPRSNVSAINNTTYKVYNPQTDSYVPVIGEKFDSEVNRWYTYDTDGVRYYNTRINQG